MPAPIDLELARRLGTDPETTAEARRAVVDRIRQQVGLYGYARLAGVGTFRQHQGRLTFEPDRSLADAVNHRFAGLEPVYVDEPAAQADTASPQPADSALPPPVVQFNLPEDTPAFPDEPTAGDEASDTLWVERERTPEPHPLGPGGPAYEEADFSYVPDETPDDEPAIPEPTVIFREPNEAVVDDAPVWQDDEPIPAAAPPAETPTIQWKEEAPEPEPEPVVEAEAPPREPAAVAAPEDAPPPPRATPAVPAAGKHRVQRGPNRVAQEQDARSSAPLVFGVLFGIIALAAVAWLFLRDTPPTPPEDVLARTDSQAVAVPADTTTLAAGTIPEDTVAALGSEPLLEDDTAPTEEVPTPTDASPLRSAESIDLAAGGYTIVVGSEVSRQAAERHAARYQEQGFRTGIVEGQTSDGRTRYRVGIGQFATSADAAAAITELRDAGIPADAWVLRIR